MVVTREKNIEYSQHSPHTLIYIHTHTHTRACTYKLLRIIRTYSKSGDENVRRKLLSVQLMLHDIFQSLPIVRVVHYEG